jgi:hypothetical protein
VFDDAAFVIALPSSYPEAGKAFEKGHELSSRPVHALTLAWYLTPFYHTSAGLITDVPNM